MLNRVILMGRLTKDPELRHTANNIQVCLFTLAVNRNFKKDGGEREADFINCVAWRNTAEFVNKYFSKGLQVVVSGRLQTRTWDDDEGKKHYVTEVVVDEAYFAESKKDYKPKNEDTGNTQSGFMPIDVDDDLPF
jgi:single-strand DNA-binding protein